MTKLADLIWKNAELLRGAFKENEYRKVILPFTILRRLDCVLQPTREAVLAKYQAVKDRNYVLDKVLTPVSRYPFFNTSSFTLPKVAETPDDVRDNLEAMVNGFSQNVRDIFEKFGFVATLDKLAEKNRLFLVVQRFAETDLSPAEVTNHDMGQAFEELLRKFNDVSPAGEQYTPRDVIELMVTLLFDGDEDALSVPGIVRTMYDPTAGTGGILSVAEEYLRRHNDRATLKLFGQELEDETYAICKADMLIRGQNPANIANGDTLEVDKHATETFDYQAANPPYGVEWKPAEASVRREHARGAVGRFAPGLPAIRDGQMLFTLHLLSKMQPAIHTADGALTGGGRIGVVHNGSPLFTGDAGSGESEIRRHILAHDHLDCIVALPTDLFYNTNITTYLWFMTNRKPAGRRGQVILIDASGMSTLMKKNLGKKRREFTADCIARIARAYADFKPLDWRDDASGRVLKAKVFDREHFFYRKVTIERPLRLRLQASAEAVAALLADKATAKLPEEQRNLLTAAVEGLDPGAVYLDTDAFRVALQASASAAAAQEGLTGKRATTLAAKALELARKHLGRRDKTAQPATDEKGDVLTDAELRDAEYVPYRDDIDAYFQREVVPHWPDAWVNCEVTDDQDGQTGVVGTEINFNREFYVYTPPRSRQAIQADIEAKEQRFMELLRGVRA